MFVKKKRNKKNKQKLTHIHDSLTNINSHVIFGNNSNKKRNQFQ